MIIHNYLAIPNMKFIQATKISTNNLKADFECEHDMLYCRERLGKVSQQITNHNRNGYDTLYSGYLLTKQ